MINNVWHFSNTNFGIITGIKVSEVEIPIEFYRRYHKFRPDVKWL